MKIIESTLVNLIIGAFAGGLIAGAYFGGIFGYFLGKPHKAEKHVLREALYEHKIALQTSKGLTAELEITEDMLAKLR